MVETLVRAMANQRIHGKDPFIEREARHKERQVKPQVALGANHVSYYDFVKL